MKFLFEFRGPQDAAVVSALEGAGAQDLYTRPMLSADDGKPLNQAHGGVIEARGAIEALRTIRAALEPFESLSDVHVRDLPGAE